MYERFTDRARKVMQLANIEAQRLNHEYISTEHILLGLVAEGSGVAAHVLKNLEVDRGKIRQEVEKIVQSGPDMIAMEKRPMTPRAKKVIEYAMEEARNLNHNYVGTEHLLLGTLRETEGIAAQALINLGLRLEDVRDEILTLLGETGEVSLRQSTDSIITDFRELGDLKYTDRARKVMLLATEEAYNFGHTYLGPEHILLAIYRAGTEAALDVLTKIELSEANVRGEIENLLEAIGPATPQIDFEHTPMAVYALFNAKSEAISLNADRIDSDHLLLGLLKQPEGIVAQVVRNFGVDRSELCEQIRGRLDSGRAER
jgi:ATP-dependent Clp protease ATP-binding subunit ClpA